MAEIDINSFFATDDVLALRAAQKKLSPVEVSNKEHLKRAERFLEKSKKTVAAALKENGELRTLVKNTLVEYHAAVQQNASAGAHSDTEPSKR